MFQPALGLANLLQPRHQSEKHAVCAALNLPARIVTGFLDEQINTLLGLDTKREVAFSMVSIGRTQGTVPAAPSVSPLELPTVPYSAQEVDYPAMRKMHAASSLCSAKEVAAWRDKTSSHELPPAQIQDSIPLGLPLDDSRIPLDTI